jgi:hypothetical protein
MDAIGIASGCHRLANGGRLGQLIGFGINSTSTEFAAKYSAFH